jgi:IS4 transposase
MDGGYFVTRAKKNMVFNVKGSHPVDKITGLRCDQTIKLKTKKAKKNYPTLLRRVSYVDATSGKRLVFLTNNFHLPAIKIAEIYKGRWRIELFFKWIKQNLRIKTFYGNSENAVKTQIWIAISTYLMVASLKKQLDLDISMGKILQILSVNPFQRVSLNQLLTELDGRGSEDIECNQLMFNGF